MTIDLKPTPNNALRTVATYIIRGAREQWLPALTGHSY
jgi:hypothetical protein